MPLVVLHHQPPRRMRLQRPAKDLVDEALVPVQPQNAIAIGLYGLGIGVRGSGVERLEGFLQVHGACCGAGLLIQSGVNRRSNLAWSDASSKVTTWPIFMSDRRQAPNRVVLPASSITSRSMRA